MKDVDTTEEGFVNRLAGLYQRLDALEKRAAQPQRPSTYATMQRAIDSLEHQAARFERQYGTPAVR